MAQWLFRALATLLEEPSLVPSTHKMAHEGLEFQVQGTQYPLASTDTMLVVYTHR